MICLPYPTLVDATAGKRGKQECKVTLEQNANIILDELANKELKDDGRGGNNCHGERFDKTPKL